LAELRHKNKKISDESHRIFLMVSPYLNLLPFSSKNFEYFIKKI